MTSRVPGSFRDPAGFVIRHEGEVYRYVMPRFAGVWDACTSAGLYEALWDEGLLVRHEAVEPPVADLPEAHAVIRAERVPFVSWPYEWSFGALKAAALLTLRIQRLALEQGFSLRDASAYNVQFHGSVPVFVDTLSFEPYEPGTPWIAYRQFCQHFLAPLALAAHVDIRMLGLLRVHIDGIPLDLASSLLPWRTRLHPGLLAHVHLHAKSLARHSEAGEHTADKARGSKVSQTGLLGILDSLEGAIRGLTWRPGGTEWADYYAATNYTEASHQHKAELVDKLARRVSPGLAWDLGGNTGRFSRLVAETGADTVAFDIDPSAVEAGWQASHEAGDRRMWHLVQDLANPAPDQGWAQTEREGLAARGPADLVLALALVHHLVIGNQVPLRRLARDLRRLGRHLVIEMVPKEDSQVRRLLASREDIFDDYTVEGFEAAFGSAWDIVERIPVRDSSRILYLMSADA